MLKEKILSDLKDSMRAKDEMRTSVLRLFLSAKKNKEIEKRAKTGKEEELSDEEILDVIRKEVKKRKEASLLYRQGKREELAKKEESEAKILEEYLPVQMGDEEIARIIEDVIKIINPQGKKDMGRVIGEVMKRGEGKIEASKVSEFVKKILS